MSDLNDPTDVQFEIAGARILRTRFTNTVTSGALDCIPLMSRSRKGESTSLSRRVQYGLI